MTTISYRHTSARNVVPSGSSYLPFFSRLANSWQQWRSLRELESLSDDVRKDLVWPAATETKNPKAAR